MSAPATRRRFLTGAAAVAAGTAVTAAVATGTTAATTAPHPLDAELARIIAMRERGTQTGSEVDNEAWEAAWFPFLRRVEALPPTPGNLRIKARCIAELYAGEEVLEDYDTTDMRLARQIIIAVAGEA